MTRCGCAGSTTFLLGSAANADAQNANVSTTLAHRTDEPHRRLNLFSILMPWSWFHFEFWASLFRGYSRQRNDTFSIANQSAQKKYSRAAGGGLSHRGHRLPVWVHRHFEAGAARHDERIRAIARPRLTRPKRISQSQRPAANRGTTSSGRQPEGVWSRR